MPRVVGTIHHVVAIFCELHQCRRKLILFRRVEHLLDAIDQHLIIKLRNTLLQSFHRPITQYGSRVIENVPQSESGAGSSGSCRLERNPELPTRSERMLIHEHDSWTKRPHSGFEKVGSESANFRCREA